MEVANPVNPAVLEARDLSNNEVRHGHPDVDQRLDLKAVAPELPAVSHGRRRRGIKTEERNNSSPEDVEAVTQVGIAGAVTAVDKHAQPRGSMCPQAGNDGAPPPR